MRNSMRRSRKIGRRSRPPLRGGGGLSAARRGGGGSAGPRGAGAAVPLRPAALLRARAAVAARQRPRALQARELRGTVPKDALRYHDDLGFLAKDAKHFPTTLTAAVHSIEKMWGLSQPVKVKKHWMILMKTGHQPGYSRPFEQVRGQIKARLALKWKSRAVENYLKDLRAKADVTIYEERLDNMKFVAKAEK